ncbi:unnamed protein product [Rotaria sp. Silwood1]|nr:unnamed protein product [Rotaria sp. Silwood1]
MINTIEDTTRSNPERLKYKIFNFIKPSGKMFTLDINERKQKFSVPDLIQVAELDMRVKKNIEQITYTYEEFYTSYFRSFSIDLDLTIPIPIPSPEPGMPLLPLITPSFGYHNTLKTAYDFITKTSAAVGIATDWWGMYTIHLGPTFLLTFDDAFNKTLVKLVSNPTTENDQSYYNQLVATFGTHYISSVIVGASVDIYTYISQNYHSQYDSSSLSQAISLGVGVSIFDAFSFKRKKGNGQTSGSITEINVNLGLFDDIAGLHGTFSWGSSDTRLSKDFKKNSAFEWKFLPSVNVTSDIDENIMKVWLERASKKPTVINRTLSSIVNLLSDYPSPIRRHLQSTIDFYLKHAHLPKLEELKQKTKTTRSKRASAATSKSIPGLDVVGCGFDIFKMESRNCLLDLSDQENTSLWLDVYNQKQKYIVPNGFFVSTNKELLTTFCTTFYSNLSQFFRNTYYRNDDDSDGFLGFGASHSHQELIEKYRQIYQYKYHFALSHQQVIWYTLAFNSFPLPKLNAATRLSLDKLPIVFNSSFLESWKNFFKAYGTHYVVRSDMGGLMSLENYHESCFIEKYTETWFRTQMSLSFWFFFSYSSQTETYNLKVDTTFRNYSVSTFKLVGGDTGLIDNFDQQTWLLTVKDRPNPVTYQLVPIYDLLPDGPQRTALRNASLYFRSAADREANLYIQRLQNTPIKPSLPQLDCSPMSQRKKRNIATTTESLFDLTKAMEELCPVVGFYGNYCLGRSKNVTDRQLLSKAASSISDLPRGVGIAIDISTGKLYLPAFETSKTNSSIWTDPISRQSLRVPPEIQLTTASEMKNDEVTIRIFRTENEMTDVWLRNAEAGYWTGGQFAYSRNISDLYNAYFAENQGTAVAQQLLPLYTLTMKKGMMKLNQYAQAAINHLTPAYNEDLYRRFIDAWGTHITISTQLGSLKELQIIFRNCMIASEAELSYMNSKQQSFLEENLKEELLNEKPCLDYYYYKRRKVVVNRRLGGNLALINDTTEWKKSVILDPALLSVIQYTPWYEFVSNSQIKANLKLAIQRRISAANAKSQALAMQVQNTRARMNLTTQLLILKKEWEPSATEFILNGTEICPTGLSNAVLAQKCGVGTMIKACARNPTDDGYTLTNQVPACYERNTTTGAFRLAARRQYAVSTNRTRTKYENIDIAGEWKHSGCSSIYAGQCYDSSNPSNVNVVFMCSGCDVQFKENGWICTCPIYPSDEAWEPYC